MRETLERAFTNPWILWSIFGAGFFIPQLFLIFLPSISMLAWRHVKSEYKETTEFWIEKSKLKPEKRDEKQNVQEHTKSPIPALSPVQF